MIRNGSGRPKIIQKERIPIEERGEMIGLRLAGGLFGKLQKNMEGVSLVLKNY